MKAKTRLAFSIFLIFLIVLTMTLGCRILGDFSGGNDAAGVETTTVLSGKVSIKNDVDTGLLAAVRTGIASGAAIGQIIPFSGLHAQLSIYSPGATSSVSLPVNVSASGTFVFTVPGSLQNLYVRVFNSSGTLDLLSIVDFPSSATPINVSEETTAIGQVVLSAAKSGRVIHAYDVESQLSPITLTAITSLITTGLKDPANGTMGVGGDPIVALAAGAISSITNIGRPGTSASSTWSLSVLGGTSLDSPVLSALAAQYGQTSQSVLKGLASGELEKAVRAAIAVGIDLSLVTPETIKSDPLISTALRLGTPIVFENPAALTSLLPGPLGGSTTALEDAEKAMAAVIGVGIRTQVAVAVSGRFSGPTEIYCLGTDPELPELFPGAQDAFDASGGPVLALNAIKTIGFSTAAAPVNNLNEVLTIVRSLFADALRARTLPMPAIRASTDDIPSEITKHEFLFKWPEYVWYPNNRGQDFVIQCSLRAQIFESNDKKGNWPGLRFIVDDGGKTSGMLNRGNLVFTDQDDKGYFIGKAKVKIDKLDDWVNFRSRSPGDVDAGPHGVKFSTYSPKSTKSSTSITVRYNSGGGNLGWVSKEERDFRMDEFACVASSAPCWDWRLILVRDPFDGETTRRLDLNYDDNDKYEWQRMVDFFTSTDWHRYVSLPMKVSRGTDQRGFHPNVQATYDVQPGETRTANFNVRFEQEAWNVWSESWHKKYRHTFRAGITKRVTVDFSKFSARTALWATNTKGNPGAYKVMQDDGNLVIYSKDGKALWASGTKNHPKAYLTMQSDGNLVIYEPKALWSTKTSGNPGAWKKMQADGNLVIRAKNVDITLWTSKTAGNSGATLKMQDDGNLVIYSQDGKALWSSGTAGNPGAYDVMQEDGNYVVYKDVALWSSGTAGNPGAYDVMQEDGNYVIYSQ